MVRMENYYPPQDRFQELWQEIDKCHMAYLDMEESSEKIEQRNKLEDYIHEFLCVTAHYQKFSFVETKEVLFKSAKMKKDFSAYKACTGFNAIQLYAQNLLSQPWRKEYRQIQTYCGFYKHQIEANLVEAEIIFEALGYNCIGEGLMVLDGPICLDRVAAISRDCLIAYVECQILKAIWEEVSSSFKISWLEVLEFRKEHICSPEQAIKSLTYKHHQRQYQEHNRSLSQGSDPFGGNRCQGTPSGISVSGMSPVLTTNHSFPPLISHHHVGLPAAPQEYFYTNGCCINNSFPTYGPNYGYMPYAQPILKPQFNTNGYYYNGYVPPMPPAYAVPTAKLIEVEPQGLAYELDKGKMRNLETVHNELYKTKNNNEVMASIIDRDSDKNESQFEDWDYVYRNLKSQGYSKDLGERGDVLSPKQSKEMKKVKATNLDEALNNLSVTDRPLKINEALKKVEREKKNVATLEVTRVDKETSPPSSYENLITGEEIKKQINKPISSMHTNASSSKTKTLPRDKTPILPAIQVQSKTLEMRKPKDDKSSKKKEVSTFPPEIKSPSSTTSSSKWQCKTCTYLNNANKEICDICSKSRNATTETAMEIGGAECAKCTLVNPKNLTVCLACGSSLKDSPTYI